LVDDDEFGCSILEAQLGGLELHFFEINCGPDYICLQTKSNQLVHRILSGCQLDLGCSLEVFKEHLCPLQCSVLLNIRVGNFQSLLSFFRLHLDCGVNCFADVLDVVGVYFKDSTKSSVAATEFGKDYGRGT
jgi:hypothetical protein